MSHDWSTKNYNESRWVTRSHSESIWVMISHDDDTWQLVILLFEKKSKISLFNYWNGSLIGLNLIKTLRFFQVKLYCVSISKMWAKCFYFIFEDMSSDHFSWVASSTKSFLVIWIYHEPYLRHDNPLSSIS